MPSTALVLSTDRQRRRGGPVPLTGGNSSGIGGEFLPDVFPYGRQSVEMAFGADLNADPSTWQWTDVTRWFQWEPGVNIRIGYLNEATAIVPAALTGAIRNDQGNGGWFTLGNPLSPFWPNVRENTPTRALLDVGNGPSIRFFGYATVYEPSWDAARKYAIVKFTANGVARRLVQGDAADQSPLWRFVMLSGRHPINTNGGADNYVASTTGVYVLPPVRYWNLEDAPDALQGGEIIDGLYPLVNRNTSGLPDFGASAICVGTRPIAAFTNGAILTSAFPDVALGASRVSSTTQTRARIKFLFKMSTDSWERIEATGAVVEIMRVATTGTIRRVSVWIDPAGGAPSMYMVAYDRAGASLGSTGLFDNSVLINQVSWVAVEFNQDGANANLANVFAIETVAPYDGTSVVNAYGQDFTLAANTIGSINGLIVAPSGNLEGIFMGHIGLWNGGEGTFPGALPTAITGNQNQKAKDRLIQLGRESNVQIEIVGDADDRMGPQGVGGFLDLVQEATAVDGGLLLDGLGPGLTYYTRQYLYSRQASMTLDALFGQLVTPLQPKGDDQGRVNDFTARNPVGGEGRYVKTTGPLGTATVGTYDDSGQFRPVVDAFLPLIASWKTHQGTIPGLRYPELKFELEKPSTAPLAQRWLDSRPGDRVDVLGIEPDMPQTDRSFLLKGWVEKWNSKLWLVTANCSGYESWGVITLADATDTGDDPFVCWLDTDGSALTADVAAGAADTATFEDGTDEGWFCTGGTEAVTTAYAHTGTYAYSGTVSGSPAQAILRSANVAVQTGTVYAASAWLYSPGGYATVRVSIDWFDAASSYLSTTTGTIVTLAAATWQQYTVFGTAPAGAAFAQYGPTFGSNPPNGTVMVVDDAVFGQPLTVATPSGPLWTNPAVATYADDVDGLAVEVSGIKVPVVAISGTTSPQTFIVDNTEVVKPLPSGSAVTVWNPPVLGL